MKACFQRGFFICPLSLLCQLSLLAFFISFSCFLSFFCCLFLLLVGTLRNLTKGLFSRGACLSLLLQLTLQFLLSGLLSQDLLLCDLKMLLLLLKSRLSLLRCHLSLIQLILDFDLLLVLSGEFQINLEIVHLFVLQHFLNFSLHARILIISGRRRHLNLLTILFLLL